MIISDFSADVSTLNFGTDKETQVVHASRQGRYNHW